LVSDPDLLCSNMVREGYEDPMLLQELLQSKNETLINDFRVSCGITNSDFAKLKLRFEKIYKEIRENETGMESSYELKPPSA
jgi:hypothetical protein